MTVQTETPPTPATTTTTVVTPPAAAAAAQEPEEEAFDKDRALATIRKLREGEKTSKAQAKELEELRAKVKAADDAKLSETERLANEAQEAKIKAERLEADLREERTLGAVEREATKLQFSNPAVAYRLLDRSKIEYGDDGKPKNVATLLEALAKEEPYLIKSSTNGTTPGNPPGPKPAGKPTEADVVDKEKARLRQSGGVSGMF